VSMDNPDHRKPPPDEKQKGEGEGEAEPEAPREIGGPKGPEPTRYKDWERNGRCVDF
jgi:hypothetical protein